MAKKKLYRARNDRIFAGVCGGLGEYFNVDADILRVIFVLTGFTPGGIPGFLIYLVMAFMVPLEPPAPEKEPCIR